MTASCSKVLFCSLMELYSNTNILTVAPTGQSVCLQLLGICLCIAACSEQFEKLYEDFGTNCPFVGFNTYITVEECFEWACIQGGNVIAYFWPLPRCIVYACEEDLMLEAGHEEQSLYVKRGCCQPANL